MTTSITELVHLPLIPNISLDSLEHKAILDSTLSTIAQQPGLTSLVWGTPVEHPYVVEMIQGPSTSTTPSIHPLEWQHVDFHAAFQNSPVYTPFLGRLGGILSGAPTIFHVDVKLHDAAKHPLNAPITQVVSAYFPVELDEQKYWDDVFVPFMKDFVSMAGGWATELHFRNGIERKVFVMMVGWESLAKQKEFQQTEGFGGVVGLFDGVSEALMRHVQFVRVV
ncbi:hypothetical protein CC86DRAFT_405443 [Ophiobolus disseminans]|uniref:ABM domain-containing protein n=1 Tax=Ophiobolus disseminans TaxID=1469910 RepID=A0A6A7A3H6_9PLEO|nr:hypothetical protein CC86DRAFT_405443 [Ophiobolus disseminans]